VKVEKELHEQMPLSLLSAQKIMTNYVGIACPHFTPKIEYQQAPISGNVFGFSALANNSIFESYLKKITYTYWLSEVFGPLFIYSKRHRPPA